MAYKATDYPITPLDLTGQNGKLTELVNGDFFYYPNFIESCISVFTDLYEELPWEQGEVLVYGKRYKEPRLTCIFALKPGETYSYSGRVSKTIAFTPLMEKLRLLVSEKCGVTFDACIANLYRNGNDKIGMHSDKEEDLVVGAPIASVTLGTPRFFDLWCKEASVVKHDRYRLNLEPGSLLVMGTNSQAMYTHGVPVQKTIKNPRINLTFRVTKAGHAGKQV